MTYWRVFSSVTPRLAPISCRPGNMMSIEIALIAISMAISVTNWGFDKAWRAGASVVMVIGIFLAECRAPELKHVPVEKARMKMPEPVVPYLAKAGSERFQVKEPDNGWLGWHGNDYTDAERLPRVLTPWFSTTL